MKVFISQVDTYVGNTVGKLLAQSVVGATSAENTGDGDDPKEEAEVVEEKTNYQIIGSFRDQSSGTPDWASEVVNSTNREQLLSSILSCDVVVYSIADDINDVDEATWCAQALHDQLSSFGSQKIFICISTIMTWARTKPLNIEEPDVPFTEEDYRRRRPHPNFKPQIDAEKLIIKLGKTDKTKFMTYVVASGLTYGEEEGIFHFFFKSAWLGKDSLKVFESERKDELAVPTIHIRDLASIILNVADSKPKTKYILAVDDSHNSMEEIVKAISTHLGTGKVEHAPKAEVFTVEELNTTQCEQLLVNLQMEATCVKESMNIDWKAESGLVENISAVIREYKSSRCLMPIRLCLLGPPAVGKSTVVQQLCKHYKLHHVNIADVIKEIIAKKERTAARADPGDEDEESDALAQEAKDHLAMLKDDFQENKGHYSKEHIISFFKEKLQSMPCQNQGFVLDGFPKTYEEAQDLFAVEENDEEEDGEGDGETAKYNKKFMPELVLSLEASNTFLKDRVINLPQSKVAGTHNTEEGLLRRLRVFREVNQEDVTVLNYFDELEIHPQTINVEGDASPNMEDTVEMIIKKVGKPRNYGPTPEEKAAMEEKERKQKEKKEAEEREEREKMGALEKEIRAKREAEWSKQLSAVEQEEQEMLETKSIPLRNYLMRHVMPTLTQGLIQVCDVRPDDPVDFLAEYLFKNNPQID